MITVTLMGGLGNQMFQYALGRHLADIHHTELCLDLGFLGHSPAGVTARRYELDVFNITAHTNHLDEANMVSYRARGATAEVVDVLRPLVGGRRRIVRQRGQAFHKEVLEAPDGAKLIGYWQSEKYFDAIADAIHSHFTLRAAPDPVNADLLEQIGAGGAVSLHVRRGDYVSNAAANAFHGLAGLDYYAAAVTQIEQHLSQPRFFVFSDDPQWCAANLRIDHPTTYVVNNAGAAHEDIRLMSACSHHIIANSAFSWWGAWLDPRDDKFVIAPKRWFNDPSVDTNDVYAAGWLAL